MLYRHFKLNFTGEQRKVCILDEKMKTGKRSFAMADLIPSLFSYFITKMIPNDQNYFVVKTFQLYCSSCRVCYIQSMIANKHKVVTLILITRGGGIKGVITLKASPEYQRSSFRVIMVKSSSPCSLISNITH